MATLKDLMFPSPDLVVLNACLCRGRLAMAQAKVQNAQDRALSFTRETPGDVAYDGMMDLTILTKEMAEITTTLDVCTQLAEVALAPEVSAE